MMVFSMQKRLKRVALRKESVDRNYRVRFFVSGKPVALRKESVDRNHAEKRKYL